MVFCNNKGKEGKYLINRHNPYFNRWFSAISKEAIDELLSYVTILILIDGFLQLEK